MIDEFDKGCYKLENIILIPLFSSDFEGITIPQECIKFMSMDNICEQEWCDEYGDWYSQKIIGNFSLKLDLQLINNIKVNDSDLISYLLDNSSRHYLYELEVNLINKNLADSELISHKYYFSVSDSSESLEHNEYEHITIDESKNMLCISIGNKMQ